MMDNEQLVDRIQAGENEAENMLQLWQQNRGFIAAIARKYVSLAEMEDLEQEGYIGLCEAVRRYDPGKGVAFINYAAFWIRQAMRRYTDNCGAVVRIPSGMHDWIREYNRALREYRQAYHEWPSDGALCWLLGIKREKLRDIQQAVRMGNMGSLDAPIETEDGDLTVMDMVSSGEELEEDVSRRLDQESMSRDLWEAVDLLPGNQPAILRMVYREGMTRAEVGKQFGFNRIKVSSIEKKALNMLGMPSISAKYLTYYNEYLTAAPIHHIGLQTYLTTWESEVERNAMRRI